MPEPATDMAEYQLLARLNRIAARHVTLKRSEAAMTQSIILFRNLRHPGNHPCHTYLTPCTPSLQPDSLGTPRRLNLVPQGQPAAITGGSYG